MTLFLAAACGLVQAATEWKPKDIWHGSNLLGMFLYDHKACSGRFYEWDFAVLEKYGFNFARLPVDYRFFSKGKDHWYEIDESKLPRLDEAVAFGRKHRIHVQICFHRIPGYTVAAYQLEKHNLFRDPEALDAACRYWACLAKRYRGVPNDELSFNLFNEPSLSVAAQCGYSGAKRYAEIIRILVKAIRDEDPDRFVMADGLNSGGGYIPVPGLDDIPNLGWATRGYNPTSVSHYGAGWMGLANAPKPVWPFDPDAPIGVCEGPGRETRGRLELIDLPPCTVAISFSHGVATRAKIRATADGKIVKEERLVPSADAPGWTNVHVDPKWKNTIGSYTGRVEIVLANGAKNLTIENAEGEWACSKSCLITSADGKHAFDLKLSPQFRQPLNFRQRFAGWMAPKSFRPVDETGAFVKRRYPDDSRECLYRLEFKALDELNLKDKVVMAGEFGVYKHTPHEMAMDFLKAYFELWKERGMGWASWGFRGDMGVINSERKDVEYETVPEGKLDRQMLELYRRYMDKGDASL